MLDDDEAVATLLALASLAATGPSAEGGVDAAATSAYGKLDQFLPARLRPRVVTIRASLETSPQPAPSVAARQLGVFADAIAGRETMAFTYLNARGERTDRRVEPYRQLHHLLRWYLLAWDLERQDWRVFRLDRVSDPARTGDRYVPRPLPAGSASEYLRQGLNRGKQPVRLLVEAPAANVIDALKFQDAEIHAVNDRQTEVGLALDSWQWLVLNLAFLDADFRISAGTAFTRACREFGERLVAAASTP
ncbi:WYL domain-containing protein [Nonomuraea sp. B12E4]|uniref:helix-turn-helix transcriptional regulator n=1 Tax=Nonomuraea sp. B12E4 TaxID=3153564 RepID=UPI00325D9996